MTSSMLAGERRWASARRGGMTVLGKVAVPKPINLPSQRLENHGLDPNVEIVPKGTLSWGSRTSSSTSNAWGSSTVSPNADGGTNSPSHLRSRPSSGGSGRPSTAGSDKTQEPNTSVWGTSSRPSSASGPLSSNKASSTLVRPHSAETRPGSSQLSRFAEPVSEHPVAWGPSATAERLGVLSSKNEGFSLSSGDFPTLGSDRDGSGKTTESQDHGPRSRPSSASGRVVQSQEKTTVSQSELNSGNVDAWRRDGQSAEDGLQHGMEKWQGDPHQYLGPNVPPQHFDAWRGPPMNGPAGLWYRGPPGGPPYGAPVPPGSFPIEPFPYFRPQMPPPSIGNSQPVPPPGPGPRGHHPRGGEIYRPQMADAYIRPGMPFRPGFYPGPVGFEGYYGPPMGYCSSNDREIPLMGMPPGPPVYNRYSGPNTPDPSNPHARHGSHGANIKTLPEGVESAHPDDAKGPFKVLLKHDAREEEETWEHSAPTNGPYPDRSFQRSLQKHERGGEHDRQKELYSRRTTGSGNCYPRTYDDRGDSSDSTKANFSEGINTVKVADASWSKKPVYVESSIRVPPPSSAPEKGSTPLVAGKDSSLMQKIEGLNAKVRASDGHYDAPYVSSEEDMNKSEPISKVTNLINEAKDALMPLERSHTSGTTGNKGGQPVPTVSRRPSHPVQTRKDHHGKGKFDSHDDGWRKRPIVAKSSAVASVTCLEPASNVHACESGSQVEAVEQALTDVSHSCEKEALSESHDSADTQAQRAKMKELARQRALQLQKEEEERINQQKAKALAKLEELNRRMQAGDALSQKAEKSSSPDVMKQDLEGPSPPEPTGSTVKPQVGNATLAVQRDVNDTGGSFLHKGGEHIDPSITIEFGTSNFVQSEIAIPQPQPLLSKQDVNKVATAPGKVTSQSSDGSVIKQKRTSYKQRPNMTPKNMIEKSVLVGVAEVSKCQNDDPSIEAREVGITAESNMANNAKVVAESSAQQRKKGNRTNKNKQKPPSPASPLPVQSDDNPAKVHTTHEKLSSTQLVLDVSSDQAATGGNHAVQPSDQSSLLPTEEGHGRIINQWKSQHPRRTQKNQHSNSHTDKFHGGDTVVWAPVRSQSKTEDAAEASKKTVSDSAGPLKSDNLVQNNSKGKRAEMERYVPKPVAKELAQHCSSQQPVLSSGSSQQPVLSSGSSLGSDGTTGRAESGPESPDCSLPTSSATETFPIESRDGDVKHSNNRQGKAHGVWRQRGSTEMATEVSKNSYKSLDHTRSTRPDGDSLKSESKCFGEFDVSDGWNMPGDLEGPLITTPVIKDEGTTGKGKRYPNKGHRSMGNSGHGYTSSGENQHSRTLSGAPEISQMDRRVAPKENPGMRSRTPPHWQPKSHALAVNNQQEDVSTGAQNVIMEGDRVNRRNYHHDKVSVPPHSEKESSDIGRGGADQSASENNFVSEAPNVGNRDSRRGRKPASFRGRPYSPNHGLVKAESAPAESAEAMQEQNNSSGVRRNANQYNRPGRSQESFGNLSSGNDSRQHNTSSGRERRRNDMHYEYQPVGQNYNSKANNFEGPADGSENVGQRYRERSQIQSKRGGGSFHGRRGGSARVNASYD